MGHLTPFTFWEVKILIPNFRLNSLEKDLKVPCYEEYLETSANVLRVPNQTNAHPGLHTTMRNERNEEIPTAIGEADRRCMCHEQNKLISTAIDEGEEPESVAVGTQSDHCQQTVLQSLNDVVNFNLFITLSKA